MAESTTSWSLRLTLLSAVTLATLACTSEPQAPVPDFTGIWSGVFTTQDEEFWAIEDFACFVGCPPEAYTFLGNLLDDPANDERPVDELIAETRDFVSQHFSERLTLEGLALQASQRADNDTVFYCEPYGYVRQVTNPLPVEIREEDGNLIFAYEEWNGVRTVYMDGRGHPPNLTPAFFGHSVGRYEGSTLVIETTAVQADLFYSFMSGGSYSNRLHGVERYTLSDDGRVLELEFTFEDPQILREPIVIAKTWILTPDLALLEDSCEDVAGQS